MAKKKGPGDQPTGDRKSAKDADLPRKQLYFEGYVHKMIRKMAAEDGVSPPAWVHNHLTPIIERMHRELFGDDED